MMRIFVLIAAAVLSLAVSVASAQEKQVAPAAAAQNETASGAAVSSQEFAHCAVLMHGIGRSPAAMRKMEKDLTRRGYAVLNLAYDSRHYDLATLAQRMHGEIAPFAAMRGCTLHFVGHSMGALVVRTYIQMYRPEKLGRVVALGSPNRGSEVADFLNKIGVFEPLYGPAGQQLLTSYDVSQTFEKPFYEIGVIAGDRTIDPVSSMIITGNDDGKVSIDSTHIDGEKDHIVLHANHATMPSNAAVIIETAHFLQYGFFKRIAKRGEQHAD